MRRESQSLPEGMGGNLPTTGHVSIMKLFHGFDGLLCTERGNLILHDIHSACSRSALGNDTHQSVDWCVT